MFIKNPMTDIDPQETQEWIESLEAVAENDGLERAHYLLDQQVAYAFKTGIEVPDVTTTPYTNTIPKDKEPEYPGDMVLEHKIRSYIRWNAMAMVVRANKNTNVGGHIATYASIATLYEVGFNHFWKGSETGHASDMVFFQGHSIPGVYARAFLEGRLTESQLNCFRQEVCGKGLPSYPHPWLMHDFWQFPTVSMGLGPMQAIYQARLMKYLQNRGLVETEGRKVWAFLGDGETDEPESLSELPMAAREKLDNLIFVVNCNLQRLDGPVRGNTQIVQELESIFRGAGWNVIKVLWGRRWDRLFDSPAGEKLIDVLSNIPDGEYQAFRVKGSEYVRERIFGSDPELKALGDTLTDEDIHHLNYGGHDPYKVYAAYDAAVKHKGQPTVILARTIKGYGMGESGEALNTSHQQKKMTLNALKGFRDQFNLNIPNEEIEKVPFLKLEDKSPEQDYLFAQRKKLGGFQPYRATKSEPLKVPALSAFDPLLKATAEGHQISTTMAFVRALNIMLRDKNISKNIVPIVSDEARTFGMEGLFRQIGIWSQFGQNYTPEDAGQLMYYKEDAKGQLLQEGINEAGSLASWISLGTAYSNHGIPMIPFFIYYAMFGFQRVGDLIWAAGDQHSRGFLMGGTAGRTTLNGEGLQHEDGHSHILFATVPNCVSYDPTFSYEVAVILQDGLRRMYQEQEDVFYYITVMNENYEHPEMPKGAEADILKGMYAFRKTKASKKPRVQLLGSGTIFREVIAAAGMLEKDWGVESDIWGCPSFTLLARDGHETDRFNRMNPGEKRKVSHVENCLKETEGPIIASTDYIKLFADQIRAYVPRRYVVLGTDGFGRSDTRERLRHFFEVDRYYVTVAALSALAEEGTIDAAVVKKAIDKYGLDPKKPNPLTV